MNWKTIFRPTSNITVQEAQEFIRKQPVGSFVLLDVRQPKEYDREHLPGATLIPAAQLLSEAGTLDKETPTLIYCASGVRSKAACQLLQGQGFKDVRNISGGIKAWHGQRVAGPEDAGMEFFTASDYNDIFTMAYAMEEGLRQLYLGLAEMVTGEAEKGLLTRMAVFEEHHKTALRHGFKEEGHEINEEELPQVMEGGLDRERIMAHFGPHLHDMEDILNLGMLLETQAFDLYSRLSRQHEGERCQKLFHHLAEEEKRHLGYLAQRLDELLTTAAG
ncbi:MAG: rhodanese-like domain-containing protein [Thermodesulfobacteriota bacterium]